jgi:hypothetical protein
VVVAPTFAAAVPVALAGLPVVVVAAGVPWPVAAMAVARVPAGADWPQPATLIAIRSPHAAATPIRFTCAIPLAQG